MREICGDEVASKVNAVWGMDEEGQLQGVWRNCGHDGLWFAIGMCACSCCGRFGSLFCLWRTGDFALSRFHSIHLAMREFSLFAVYRIIGRR